MKLSLRDFSFYLHPATRHLMGSLKGYFDDSGDGPDPNCNCVVYAGYAGELEDWDKLQTGWSAALERAGVPYLHMKELMSRESRKRRDSPYRKWQDDEQAIEAFLLDLAAQIQGTSLRPIAAAIDKAALGRLNAKHGLAGPNEIDAEALAIYTCCWLAQGAFGENVILEFVADKTTKPNRLLARVEEIGEHESREVPFLDHITVGFLPNVASSRDMFEIQVADFLAWEVHYFTRNRIRNGGEINDALTRPTFRAVYPIDHKTGVFVNDRTLISWDENKKGAWPNTFQGRKVKSWNEFWRSAEKRLTPIE